MLTDPTPGAPVLRFRCASCWTEVLVPRVSLTAPALHPSASFVCHACVEGPPLDAPLDAIDAHLVGVFVRRAVPDAKVIPSPTEVYWMACGVPGCPWTSRTVQDIRPFDPAVVSAKAIVHAQAQQHFLTHIRGARDQYRPYWMEACLVLLPDEPLPETTIPDLAEVLRKALS